MACLTEWERRKRGIEDHRRLAVQRIETALAEYETAVSKTGLTERQAVIESYALIAEVYDKRDIMRVRP